MPPEEEVVHPSEAEVANGEADVEENDNVPHASLSPLHQNPKGVCEVGQRQNAWTFFLLFSSLGSFLFSSFGLLEEEPNEAESKSKADGATPEAAEVVKLRVDRPVHVIAQDVGREDAAVHHRDPDGPRFLVRCVREESIAPDQEDDVGAEECREIFEPEKLNVELAKEIDVDDHGDADQEEAKIRKHYQELSPSSITPGSEK